MRRKLGRDRGNNAVRARQVGIAHNRLGQSIAIALVLCVGATSSARVGVRGTCAIGGVAVAPIATDSSVARSLKT